MTANESDEWLTQIGGLASRLRDLRTAAGFNGKQMADAIGWVPSKVSRIENGRQAPTEEEVDLWARATGAGPEVSAELVALLQAAIAARYDWRRRMGRGQEAVQASYNQLVAESKVFRDFETAYVPGMLQTPDYARAVFAEMVRIHDLVIDDVETAVATRMQRQQMLYEPNRQFEFLIAEPVLRWRMFPASVMRGQLDRLQTVIGMPNIRFGILPLDRPISMTPQNSFSTYDEVAIVETFAGETIYSEPDSATYLRAMDVLWSDAATGDDARRLIVAAASSLTAQG